MKAMDPTAACLLMGDDLLDFSLDDEDEVEDKTKVAAPPSSFSVEEPSKPICSLVDQSPSFPEFVEEELEWLTNKDAFPKVETCLDLLSNPSSIIQDKQSPISVLENSTSCSNSNSTITNYCGSLQVPVSYPVRPRSKCRQRRQKGLPELPSQQCRWWNQENIVRKEVASHPLPRPKTASTIGRRCQHCLAEKTPQWRAGPMGPKTLCNACGVRYKSGRLVPEYRPASSPTFSSVLHSNSHRKVLEMRKHKQMGGMIVSEACGYSAAFCDAIFD